MARTKEHWIQFRILRLMQDGKVWTNARLKDQIGRETDLTEADRQRADFRPNEGKWEQIVNNALSPSRSSSLYGQGAVENCGKGRHRITEVGRVLRDKMQSLHDIIERAFGDFAL